MHDTVYGNAVMETGSIEVERGSLPANGAMNRRHPQLEQQLRRLGWSGDGASQQGGAKLSLW
jgi:hypothetical protein